MSTPAGWYPDPSGRHEVRYFDGQWTDHVSNRGVAATDPLSAGAAPGASGATPTASQVPPATPASQPTYGAEPTQYGAQQPQYGTQPQPGAQPAQYGTQPQPGAQPAQYGTQPQPGAQPAQYGTQPQYGAQPQHGTQPQYGSQPQYGGQPQYGNQTQYGGQPPYGGQAPYAPAPATSRGSIFSSTKVRLAIVAVVVLAAVGITLGVTLGGGGGKSTASFCAQAKTLSTKYNGNLDPTSLGAGELSQVTNDLNSLANASPSGSVAKDIRLLSSAVKDLADGNTSDLVKNEAAIQQAGTQATSYIQNKCGVNLGG